MRKELFEKVLTSLYPNTKILIKEYEIQERFELDEKGEFVKSEPCIFVGIETIKELLPESLGSDETNNVSDEVCKFTGKDFNIYKL